MEKELMKCQDKENFASFWISRLFDSDFGKKTKRSTIEIPAAPVPLVSSSPTPGLSASVPNYTLIYSTQPSGIRLTLETYGTPAALDIPASSKSGTGPTCGAYIQPPSIESTPAAYMPPGIGPTSAVYM